MRKIVFILLLLVVNSCFARAQNEPVQKAFAVSMEYEAIAEYSKAIAAMKSVYEPTSYEINLRLGWLSYLAGLFTESTAYYQKCINLMPYSIEPRFGYVYPASAMGNWDQVKTQYQKILAVDPQNTKALYKYGLIQYGEKDFQNAHKKFEKIINLYPFDYESLLMYGWTSFQLGKLREAKVIFNKVLMISPGNASAIEGLNLIK